MQVNSGNPARHPNITPPGDQALMHDLMHQETALMNQLCVSVTEGSQPGLRNVMNEIYLQISQDQWLVNQLMQGKGWRKQQPAKAEDIKAARQKYETLRKPL